MARPSSSPPSLSPSQAQSPSQYSSPPSSVIWPSPSLSPSRPPPPLPWTWTCHRCSRRYNIAITRRCLSCSHHFCLWRLRHGTQAQVHDMNVCAIEFDYVGWKAWMEWRRESEHVAKHDRRPDISEHEHTKLGLGTDATSLDREKRKRCDGQRKHDCSIDCDYPSQCLHQRYAALKECVIAEDKQSDEDRIWEDARDMAAYDHDIE
ncbi:hypothetical protein QQS21_003283 [Conoideocrella luteorostrata]|uniref:Uncharacterized protein n=1 Tax=Conoideocrella luteorostrata TaxID=1105319 RepID=A0AAJ0CTM6_9HYPO|nr:hypothetical protein QQS21_003283 [Conoideocrella luteorostrata]